MDRKRLFLLYDQLLTANVPLETLFSMGWNEIDLHQLEKKGVFRIEHGICQLNGVNHLYRYGAYLKFKKKGSEAIGCFLKCHEMDPSHWESCLQVCLRLMEQKEYLQVLDNFLKIEGEAHSTNLYLLLLSSVIPLPHFIRANVLMLTRDDLEPVSHSHYEPFYRQKKIRTAIFENDFNEAFLLLRKLREEGIWSLENEVMLAMVRAVLKITKEKHRQLLEFYQDHQYQKIEDFWKKEQRCPSKIETYIGRLLDVCKQMKNTGNSVVSSHYEGTDVWDVIDHGNYNLAHTLMESYLQKNGFQHQNHLVARLLEDIQVWNLWVEQQAFKDRRISLDFSQSFTENFITVLTYDPYFFPITFTEDQMITNYPQLLEMIHHYLAEENCSHYQTFLDRIAQLCRCENDFNFLKLRAMFYAIVQGSFYYSLISYTMAFYESLASNRHEEARIYLELIKMSDQFGQPCTMIKELSFVFENSKSNISVKKLGETPQYK